MKKMKGRFLIASLLCLCFYACGNDDEGGDFLPEDGIELPALRSGANDVLVSHSTQFNGNRVITFTAEYDKSKKHARWVAFRFDRFSGQTLVERTKPEPFEPDPTVEASAQRVQADFGRKGYDRGHICASADRLYSREANVQTFYYTNMSPQKNAFNTGVWQNLESKVQAWGRSCKGSDALYVVKGGTIDKADQIKEYIGGDRTKPVPKYYYMALLFRKDNTYKAIAFWTEHDKPYVSNVSSCAISIDELEKRTGIDFFPVLPDKLENAVEASFSVKQWPGLN